MYEIVRYSADKAAAWNAFAACSKNGTFLLDRGYMDYHSDRFADHSLMVYDKGRLCALLPANDDQKGTWWSHQGLTYGGLLMDEQTTAARVQQLFRELNDYLRLQGFHRVIYKPVPHIFHRIPSEEDVYSLFSVCHAQLVGRNISSTIDLSQRPKWHRDRKYGINKALANGVAAGESSDWQGFWEVLELNLLQKYASRPVHTLQEITLLHSRFPQNIRLFTATKEGRVLGGTVIYVTPVVVHAQYISANMEGKQLRVIDALFDHILHHVEWNARYFDFGTSNEDDGLILVEPLIYQKEGFGGRGVCYDRYAWEI